MLQEERFEYILSELNRKSAVKVAELAVDLKTSESTVRRDITELDEMGKLKKVFGGAVSISGSINTVDADMTTRQTENVCQKETIAKYAASLINEGDFVFIDAGTTTEHMIKYIDSGLRDSAFFVTNGITHAMIALAFLIDTIAGAPRDASFGSYTAAAAFFKTIGGYAFSFMIPVLAGYIAKSIADRPGLAVGFVGGFIATTGSTFAFPGGVAAGATGTVSGFLGALLAGFVGGYIVILLRKIFAFLPKAIENMKKC